MADLQERILAELARHVPRLVAEVDRLRAELRECHAEIRRLRGDAIKPLRQLTATCSCGVSYRVTVDGAYPDGDSHG